MRLGTALAIRGPLSDVIEQAQVVDALGYDSIWVPEVAGRDALVTCAALSPHVPSARIATGVVPLPVRSPTTLAMAAAALSELTEGRFVLGVGSGHAETLRGWYGVGNKPSVARTAEYLEILRSILHGGEVSHGDIDFRLRGAYVPEPPKLLLAALGPQTARLAGRLADGVILNWVTPEYAAGIIATVRQEAESCDRDPDELELACYVPTCVTEDVDVARFELARQITAYGVLRAYRRVLEASGFAAELDAIAKDPRPGSVSRHLADAVGAHGSPDEVFGKLDEFRAAGITLPVLVPYPVGEDPWASMTGTWAMLAGDAD